VLTSTIQIVPLKTGGTQSWVRSIIISIYGPAKLKCCERDRYLSAFMASLGNTAFNTPSSFGQPFALKMLHLIADRTTPRSGVTCKLARKNLLQQLSVQLWMSSAKMVLRYWALQGSDDDDNPLSPKYIVPLVVSCSLVL